MSEGLVSLFMPRRLESVKSTSQQMPLELLALSGPLLERGYEVEIIDANVQQNYVDLLSVASRKSICLGISCLFSHQVSNSLEMVQKVRQWTPSLQIVWGGWFPSVMPQLFLDRGVADLVVIGQGETTFLQVVEGIAVNGGCEVPGTASKSNGKVNIMPPREITQLEDLPPMPFSLLDYETYYRSDPKPVQISFWSMAKRRMWPKSDMRVLWYLSSWGCPNSCEFCCSPGVTRRRWTALSPKRMLGELGQLTAVNKVDAVLFIDPNFFADRRRVVEMCRLKEEMGLGFAWQADACPDRIAKMSGSELESLSRSGCYCLFVGAESGSEETLKAMKKHHQPQDNELCAELLVKHHIAPIVSYVIGIPGEDPESIDKTIEQARRIKAKNVDIMIQIFYYLPLPGSGFYQGALKYGFTEPKGLDEWAEFSRYLHPGADNPYKRASQSKSVNRSQNYRISRLNLFASVVDLRWFKERLGLIERLFRITSIARLRYNFFFLPIESLVLKVRGKIIKLSRYFKRSTQL
jgi:anaerobic magnesium-protoporphyrin IX monomethyl ester cyclase